MIAGLKDAKLSRKKRKKVYFFRGGKTEDLMFQHYYSYRDEC